MDTYQQQQRQQHRYMRPPAPPLPTQPPPPPSDPHLQHHHQYHHHQHHQPPPPPPGSWYSNQFQYQHHHNPSPSPPTPPPQQPPSQWGPPPQSDHFAYPPPPPLPYPPPTHNVSNQFPPPPPPPPRPYMSPAQIPHTFSHVNQEWNNPNLSHHQAYNNVEDWGAKAREWANTRASMWEQPVQSQITPAGRPEEQNHFHDPYSYAVDSHNMDAQQSLLTSSYPQFPVPAASSHRPPTTYPTETLSYSCGPSSYIPDGYNVRDGTSALDPNSGFLHQESLPTGSSVNLQEVPSSYSSVSGKENSANQEQSYKSFSLPISSAQETVYHVQPPVPDIGRSVLSERSFIYGGQTADPAAALSDRPLDFAPRFSSDCDPQMQSNSALHESIGTVGGIDPIAAASSINSWTPPVPPGAVYPPALPPRAQHDPLSVPSSVSGHAEPSFPRFPGPSFQPTIPSASAPFGLGMGAQLHPATTFPGDMYGAISERPKKGPVPNWLKEEILRNKATIAKSSLEHPKEETQSTEDEAVDKNLAKSDQADIKSIESSRSTEEEDDDDEDYVEAARTAAVNQEIKRVLTEVLLKVTDELFDEIATKVVNEDDSTVEVDHNTVASNHKVSSLSSPIPTPKASARVLVPGKAKEPNTAGARENSSSPGNLLGLANYASDDEDEADEIQSARMPDSRSNAAVAQSSIKKPSQIDDASENDNSRLVLDENRGVEKNFGTDMTSKNNRDTATDNSEDRNCEKSLSGNEINFDRGKVQGGNNGPAKNDALGESVIKKSDSELPDKDAGKKSTKYEFQGRETKVKSDKKDQHESRDSSFRKNPSSGRELEVNRSREDENHRREEERLRKQNIEDRNSSKEKVKEPKSGEKAKEPDSRKSSHHLDAKDDKKDALRSHGASAKEDVGRKRERTKEEDRSRHKLGSDSSRNKRRSSSSISSRGRNSKDNSGGHANDSSDEASDGSKRKLHSRKRHSSPSPVRSSRR
ncbi:hypothetical protein PTKIN_Ptkin02bG0080000 [Pterospermum kingtungense]